MTMMMITIMIVESQGVCQDAFVTYFHVKPHNTSRRPTYTSGFAKE